MFDKKNKIFIAGHKGMVGSSIFKKLKQNGYSNLLFEDKKKLNLLNQNKVFKYLRKTKPNLVIIAAAKVGGILANSKLKEKFLYENLQIQNNLILDSKRDWGHARDYVEAMWKILQQKKPNDYVIATGKQHSIRQFINFVAKKLNMKIIWKGTGLNEVGYDVLNKKKIILVDKNYIRPLDVNTLLGNAAKARRELKWKPQINIHTLIDEMITEEMNILSNDQ